MILRQLTILNYKNIREAQLKFSPKLNVLLGNNGQGKTNILDAIYLLSFTKSAFNPIDSQNITYGEKMALLQGDYDQVSVSCGLKVGVKKQFRLGKTDYKRLLDHIGLIPLVMVSPEDSMLVVEGSEERRRFLDIVIAQQNKCYLEYLSQYNALLKQRNALLKQLSDTGEMVDDSLLETFEQQMIPLAEYVYNQRKAFVQSFIPIFQNIYTCICGGNERVSLRYQSQLDDRTLIEAYPRTRQRDLLLGWTSQGIHKDDLEMLLSIDGMEEHLLPLKRVGSQGQQKTYLIAMKLAQAVVLGKPILLLDDIFDKLDTDRVQRIIQLVQDERFGQIFITDTDRQHLSDLLEQTESRIFYIRDGQIQ